MSQHDLEESFGLRLLLEVPATYRGVSRVSREQLYELRAEYNSMKAAASARDEASMMFHDQAFHSLILEAAGNTRLQSYVGELRGLVLRQGPVTSRGSRTLNEIAEEHETILVAIECDEPAQAATMMRRHLAHTLHLLLRQEFPNDAVPSDILASMEWTNHRPDSALKLA
jgi:DNA-binding GntR family transcriptional regulator